MIVLDDGEEPTKCALGQDYRYWPEMRGRGSMVKKVRRAVQEGIITGDGLVFWEDDDHYSDDYLAWVAEGLSNYILYGEGRALYYTVRGRYWFEHSNLTHASLCATSIRREGFDWLMKQCTISECPFLDVRLWNKVPLTAHVEDPYKHPSRFRRSVGIKAMPGRSGYGGGHRGRDRSAVNDPDLVKLRSLIGADADAYAEFYDPATIQTPEKNLFVDAKPSAINFTIAPMTPKLIARSEAGRVHGPNWLKWLGHLRDTPAVGLEIGTFKGDSAEFFLDNIFTHPNASYHCVDPFTGSVEHHVGKIDVTRLEEATRAKLEKHKNVTIHKGYSQDIVRTKFPKDFFDFAYIDGSHTTRDVLRDAVLVFDLLKTGGVMIFDDYAWAVFPNEMERPKTGIDAFLKCYTGKYELLRPTGWQIAIKKTKE